MTNTYPIPFSEDFYKDINKDLSKESVYKKVENKYTSNKTVILIKVIHQKRKYLLDELTDWILANSIITRVGKNFKIQKIKSNGSLGIFVCDDTKEAINFAKDLKEELKNLFNLSIGIAKGDVLIFDLGKDVFEIAGEPVNIASKIAEDSGEKNCVLVESSVECNEENCKSFKYNISHVDISGVIL